METTTRLLLPEVRQALRDEPETLVALTEEMHPADLADLALALEPELAQQFLRALPVTVAARLLEMCDEDKRAELFRSLAENERGWAVLITDEMAADDRADLYADLPSALRVSLLADIAAEESRDIRLLLSYAEDTAGALLTTDFVALPADATASDAIDLVRKNAAEMETIYQAYAVDTHGTLLGVISLRDLVTSPADRTINQIMNPNIVSVPVDADQEEAARLMKKYDLLALPVVDRSHHIAGIITFDDVLDVVEEEATEDAHKIGAVDPLDTSYIQTPILQLVKARAPWLLALFIGVMATENVLQHYSESGSHMMLMLLWFVPLIISTGGNAGSQSATLIIRAIAVGKLSPKDNALILRRELIVGTLLGLIIASVGVIRVLATSSTRSIEMVLTISCSLMAVVMLGALLGSGVPLLLRRLRIDPAVSSTPFIASIVDIGGLILYFEIAKMFF